MPEQSNPIDPLIAAEPALFSPLPTVRTDHRAPAARPDASTNDTATAVEPEPVRTPAGAAASLEQAFTAAVGWLLEGDSNLLRYTNRRRLLDLAARMGIPQFEANLLIERTRFRRGRPAISATAPAAHGVPQFLTPSLRRRLGRLLVILAAALAIDLAALAVLMML